MFMQPRHSGWIEVICGPMFSGKTEELIRRLRRAELARQSVQIFKPEIDTRYGGASEIVSHNSRRLTAEPVSSTAALLERVNPDTAIVGIDEAQFFDAKIVQVAESLANSGKRVVVAGLDLDYQARPFEPMPALIAIADFVTKLSAVCMQCGDAAVRSQRVTRSTDRVEIGAAESYEARCRRCFVLELPEPIGAPDGLRSAQG